MRLALHRTTTRSASKMHVRVGGATREVERAWLRVGGVTKQFFSALDAGGSGPGVTVDNSSVSGAGASSSTITITTRAATVTVTGGVAPYSYSWAQSAGDPMTATNATGNSSAFSASVAPGSRLSAMWTCTVTDSAGSTGSVSVTASLFNRGGSL